MQRLTLKSGQTFNGFWNGKIYNTTVYFNVSADGTKKGIDFKHSKKLDKSEIRSIVNIDEIKYDDSYSETVTINKYVSHDHVSDICPRCHTRCYGDCQS